MHDRPEIFRAIVDAPWGREVYGPYARRQDAKAALRRENSHWPTSYDKRAPRYPEHIEVSELNWKVDE